MTWLFWLSNTPLGALRMLFYPETYLDRPTTDTVQELRNAQEKLPATLFTLFGQEINRMENQLRNLYPYIFEVYFLFCMRWIALYSLAKTKDWFDLNT